MISATERERLRAMLRDLACFTRLGGKKLRTYQREAAKAVIESVLGQRGLSLAVMFPRQSGKNELQAQIEVYLLLLYHAEEVEIVKISPTWRPQSINAMRRLERTLAGHPLARQVGWVKENGYSYRVGKARISFFSGEPQANIVGATASLLLEVDEAQSVGAAKFDTQIAPMAASTNATRVFWGTAWTRDTLLARELRAAEEAQARDGRRRVFRKDALEVGALLPAYARFVEEQVARLGRMHPAVRTQYFSEEIDALRGMFPPERLRLVEGEHAWLDGPLAGEVYAFVLDVGGEAAGESAELADGEKPAPRDHDSTALAALAVQLDGSGGASAPAYRLVHLWEWRGVGQPELLEQIVALARQWNPRRLVVDATGLGAGLAANLERKLAGRVLRFTFSAASKSRLGWSFLAIVENGRLRLPRAAGLVERLREQMRACTALVGQGPDQPLRWGVPEGRKGADGLALHDDLLLAVALCAELDGLDWRVSAPGMLVRANDPIRGLDREKF
jgi:hypothetical protein